MERTHTRPVLVVDDDPDFRRDACAVLAEAAVPVVAASDGADALRYLRDAPVKPGLIVLDVVMPNMDGRRFAAEVRKEPALKAIPIVVLSGVATAEDIGAVARFMKPITPDDLLDAVHRHALL